MNPLVVADDEEVSRAAFEHAADGGAGKPVRLGVGAESVPGKPQCTIGQCPEPDIALAIFGQRNHSIDALASGECAETLAIELRQSFPCADPDLSV